MVKITLMQGIGLFILGIFILGILYRRKLQAILSETIQIYFDGEPREILPAYTYDYNEDEGTVMLVLGKPGSVSEVIRTGYVFSEDDFSPSPRHVDWRNYTGIIKCFKSFDAHKDGRVKDLQDAHESIRMYKKEAMINKQIMEQKTDEYGLKHLDDERKKETFHNAEMLESLKKLVTPPMEQKVKEIDINKLIDQ